MSEYDYNKIFDVPYLSGCCMVVKSSSFISYGGLIIDSLYLEDADLSYPHLADAYISHILQHMNGVVETIEIFGLCRQLN